MHLVVELFFDRAAEAAVRAVWRALAEEVPQGFAGARARPHVSVTVYEELEVAGFRTALAAFAAERPPLEVRLESWSAFATGRVVFLAPVVTRDLLALHEEFHRRFAAFGAALAYHRPGDWIPHCTLAAGFPTDLLPKVAELCHRTVRPIRGRIERIGLVEYAPRWAHCTFPFGATGRSGR